MIKCILFFILSSFLFSLEGLCQIDYKENSTEKIKKDPDLEPENNNPRRKLLSIFIKDTQNVLYGNPCMDKVTQRFGYEYIVMPKNAKKFHSGFQRNMHNFFVKTALFFRNPFWKIISNKKAKECRQKTGDYAG
ncbi:hypothetical protein MATR_30580 [Marivirga tractuosa]|uniref:Uncharacterized protein n=1 Tax=Marivirga tractuosa (strain ATCC 23168 / DSM 4126 / NBRC 15989 / NCIMB 1408 / VKM B-1430 / H-43) TaxID=643867 RepID=E4TUK0_MARTH|nr:hypothetical protein [Marivirga tractuosa]ADR23093.1 hypothetical protein Ftrac_3118 [Marivirga tractuosa DSM 4126]BDD16233.1 hypothetical protein MATR_30580 [Marivirga tractuosa]